jgi:hypothetical protein
MRIDFVFLISNGLISITCTHFKLVSISILLPIYNNFILKFCVHRILQFEIINTVFYIINLKHNLKFVIYRRIVMYSFSFLRRLIE